MDSLSTLFSRFAVSARSFFSGNLCTSVDFDHGEGLGYLHILRSGSLTVTGVGREPLQIEEPTILLLPRRRPHRFQPDEPRGADLICATVDLGDAWGNPVARGLPDLLAIPIARVGTIGPTLDLLIEEAFGDGSGRQIALDRLFEYLLIQILRHIIDIGMMTRGVVAALSCPRLSRAITAIHQEPGRAWTLVALAEVAGMSRTRFAGHFREIVGLTAMDYITRWRMTIAQRLLRERKPIKAIARTLGYESSSAWSRAFHKTVGTSPTLWLAQDDGRSV